MTRCLGCSGFILSVAITAYALDSYPARSGKISYFLNFPRVAEVLPLGTSSNGAVRKMDIVFLSAFKLCCPPSR
jgi:hypothetical protein